MKIGRNEQCPCGSGKKSKKCCQAERPLSYTRAERTSARTKLLEYVDQHLVDEDDLALDEFWEPLDDLEDTNLNEHFSAVSEQVLDDWFVFDRQLATNETVVERFLAAEGPRLTRGERAHLEALKASTMRLYRVEELSPGESLTLVDLIEGGQVTVQEKLGSRSLHRFDALVARVVVPGASGKPELEGLLTIAQPWLEGLRAAVKQDRADDIAQHPGASLDPFYRSMPPHFHEVWARSILTPAVPRLANTDGEEMVVTRIHFSVLNRGALVDALEHSKLERGKGETWSWYGPNVKGEPVSLGLLRLRGDSLELEVNSVARGTRGRALIEQLGGDSIRHQATTHEDMQQLVRESLKSDKASESSETGLSPELQEALVLDHLSKHYRDWLDIPVPMIDDLTPREAAKRPAMRQRTIELLQGLDGMYQRALEENAPAFDPSWLWDELELCDEPTQHPPPLAFERLIAAQPAAGALIQSVAEQTRKAANFNENAITADELRLNFEVQRYVREAPEDAPTVAPWLPTLVNFELHRRKAFWVDEALAYMLAGTDLDVRAPELRVPFVSFALVFTDRHVLSMGERLLARQKVCPIKGRYLRVLTVFVTERGHGDERALDVCFAFDALGSDLPVHFEHTLELKGDEPVQASLDHVAPLALETAAVYTNPLRGLLQVALNAVLYATSAGVEAESRPPPTKPTSEPRTRGGPPLMFSSDSVFFLPGAIEISQVRALQQLDRQAQGRGVLRRFMVRGHWRRARVGSPNQRLSWVRPHWKGPDLATIIERTYKLKT